MTPGAVSVHSGVALLGKILFLSRFGQPEIQNLHAAIPRNHDVVRLQIAMNDAMLVRGGETFCDLDANSPAPVEEATERFAQIWLRSGSPSTSSVTM